MFGLEQDITLIIAVLTGLTGLVGSVWKIVSEIRADKRLEDKQREMIQNTLEKVSTNLDEVKHDVKNVQETACSNRDGIKDVQRYRLYHDFLFEIERGWTTTERLKELTLLYYSYRKLGGNGTISKLYERYEKLPVKKEEVIND